MTILVRVKDLTFCNSDHCSQSSANQNYIDFSPSIGPLQWCNCFLFVLFVYFRDKMSKSISLNAVEAQNAIVSDHFSRVALSGPSPYDTNSHIFCILKTVFRQIRFDIMCNKKCWALGYTSVYYVCPWLFLNSVFICYKVLDVN